MSLEKRLRDERERLGLTLVEFGAIAGAGKTTVINWEKGSSAPDAVQMAALVAQGVDALYVLTGERSESGKLSAEQQKAGYTVEVLTKEEQALLDNYRHAPEIGKRAVEATVEAVATKPTKRRGPSM